MSSPQILNDPPVQVSYRTCPLCEATCGLRIEHTVEQVLRVRGDREDILSRGYACPKGIALGELHHDPDRLRRPLIKDAGRFREASWEEALARVEQGLAPYLTASGRPAIGAYVGNPTVHNLGGTLFLRPLLKSLGTRQIFSASTVDQIPKNLASGLLFGDASALPVPDIERTDYLLILGANPWESNGSLWTAPDLPGRLRALRRRGGQFVVVDPRRTRTAAHANEHLAIRPGYDALWLLALIQVIETENLARPAHLAGKVDGLERLTDIAAPFSPEAVAHLTDIAPEVTRRIARELAASRRAAVYARIGTHANRLGTLAAWATEVLNILTGNLDREGGVMFPLAAHDRPRASTAKARGFSTGRWHSRVSGYPEVLGELPCIALTEEIETPGEGQVRALLTIAGNPVLSTPDGQALERALAQLDFMVSVDIYLNETTRHADVILPPAGALERPHYDVLFLRMAVRNIANFSPPVFETSARDEAEILLNLAAIAQGLPPDSGARVVEETQLRETIARDLADPASPVAGCEVDDLRALLEGQSPGERLLDYLLRSGPYGDGFTTDRAGLSLQRLRSAPHGIDLGPLQPRLGDVLRTASGRVELHSEIIATELGRARALLAERAPAAQLLLIGRREFHSNNSWMHNLPSLIERPERCTLRMHADDAARLALQHGQQVMIISSAASQLAPLEIHAEMRPGVVSLPHGYGHRHADTRQSQANAHPGVSANDLLPRAVEGPSGNAVLSAIPVTVSAA